MVNSDIVALVGSQIPSKIVFLRDKIAQVEAQHPGHLWERRRDVYDDVKRLKHACEESRHPLLIALAGQSSTWRISLRIGRSERRSCIMCGTEEIGKLGTGLIRRFGLGRSRWNFEKLNGRITRIFTDPEAYLHALSFIRQYSLPTEVVLQHALPPRLPPSLR
jgi:hypothetical protein